MGFWIHVGPQVRLVAEQVSPCILGYGADLCEVFLLDEAASGVVGVVDDY